jgi:histidinol-phosphate aminotransferase
MKLEFTTKDENLMMKKIDRKFNPSIPHDKLRLHSAERNTTWGKIFEKYKKELTEEDIKFYPNTSELNPYISEFFGYDNFLMGFGSDRCIKYFLEANSKKHWFWGRKRLIVSDPCFPMYNVYGQIHNTRIVKVPYYKIKFDVESYIQQIDNNSLVVFSNPSSPIGDIVERADIIRILELGQPTLIDEAYIEFSNQNSCIDLIDKYPNLYVTRTFSKAYGSAGTRFGVIFSQKQNIENMLQYRDMYETTGQTLKWIKTICTNKKTADKYIEKVKKVRGLLLQKLYYKGIYSIPSESNWIHVRENEIPSLPESIVFRKDCKIPELGDNWVRLQITDNIKDYDWILK